jgi:formyltetrahydrofolate deformylase
VSGFLLEQGCDILESKQFDSQDDGHFFMRIHFASAGDFPGGPATLESLREAFVPVAEKFGMQWQLRPHGTKRRVLVMVSKFEHCLNDLLFRARIGELPIDIVAVVSNHPDHRGIVEWHGIPFFHVPVTADTKPAAEESLMELVDRLDVELVVLARYMQVLSDDLTRRLDGRAINIHHSFLPSFKGAKPYHQAHARGVKLIGATAHYVTAALDEGPIIEQEVIRVDHRRTAEQFVQMGRDVEARTLAQAVQWHAEHRVLLDGNRTVVFN